MENQQSNSSKAVPIALVISAVILAVGMLQLGRSIEKAGANSRSATVNVPSSLTVYMSPGTRPLEVKLKQE